MSNPKSVPQSVIQPIKVVDLDLSQPISPWQNLAAYQMVQATVRWQGRPIACVEIPILNGQCETQWILDRILQTCGEQILKTLLLEGLSQGNDLATLLTQPTALPSDLLPQDRLQPKPAPPQLQETPQPKVTVVICTRDRPEMLKQAIASLQHLTYPNLELLVVDNAPRSDATQILVQTFTKSQPPVRYIREDRPGLDWARNRGILAAQGDIVAFTDDDAIVDPGWVDALVRVFADSPVVMAVTGLVVPWELVTPAQVMFEQQGGFGKGYDRRWAYFPQGRGLKWTDLGTGIYGTGANMAFRRSLFARIGGFDPALDVGTVTGGAGDLEMFLRVLRSGGALVYEPAAIVRHQHRRDWAALRSQLAANGAVYAMLQASATRFPDLRWKLWRLGLSWGLWGNLVPWLQACCYPAGVPSSLRWAQLQGCWRGLGTYARARRQAKQVWQQLGQPTDPSMAAEALPPWFCGQANAQLNAQFNAQPDSQPHPNSPAPPCQIQVCQIELTEPLPLLFPVNAQTAHLFLSWQGSPIAQIQIPVWQGAIGRLRLTDAIIQQVGLQLLQPQPQPQRSPSVSQSVAQVIAERLMLLRLQGLSGQGLQLGTVHLPPEGIILQLDPQIAVSIVVATCDRPEALACCLQSLSQQCHQRSLEIIVVDNRPASGLTPPVVTTFADCTPLPVKLVQEPRAGVNYARNAGILASKGEIIVTVDDDVVIPPGWLERLIAPFTRKDVMAVTGNVLPLELATRSQQIFEAYGNGGLGRGFVRFEVGTDWFNRSFWAAIPTWELGGTANSAYRASLFAKPTVGLMDEALGPGMPSGAGEDIYLFYRILKAGDRIVYEPSAHVWHQHRREMSALRKQLYNYSKGFIAYHLTTLFRDRDWRSLTMLLLFLPLYRIKQFWVWLTGDRIYPLSLIGVEIVGSLAGGWALWRSWLRVRRWGRSGKNDGGTMKNVGNRRNM
ncbi:MAG: glycosyltransferase [Synechococcales bacterium]|nr:glycosyltransferase [Synechococcales bacterium]